MAHPDLVGMCVRCGWISLAEIQRQARYWTARLLEAVKMPEGE